MTRNSSPATIRSNGWSSGSNGAVRQPHSAAVPIPKDQGQAPKVDVDAPAHMSLVVPVVPVPIAMPSVISAFDVAGVCAAICTADAVRPPMESAAAALSRSRRRRCCGYGDDCSRDGDQCFHYPFSFALSAGSTRVRNELFHNRWNCGFSERGSPGIELRCQRPRAVLNVCRMAPI